jgi:D-sedoheptulose 7-phosphate isomerase
MSIKDNKLYLFHEEYLKELNKSISTVSQEEIDLVIEKIVSIVQHGRRIWAIGNGGSAATASHFVADLMRPTNQKRYRVMATSLAESSIRISAIGNDYGFEKSFEYQLSNLAGSGDLLVVMSASGRSPNLINGVNFAKGMGVETISMVGFDGGSIKRLTELCLHFQTVIGAYEIAEDCHSLICHYIAKNVRLVLEQL